MGKEIEPKLQSIGDYLKIDGNKNKKFVVPVYQRAYSWDKEMCSKLWQDIQDFIRAQEPNTSPDPYFFGTVIADCSDDKVLTLIDGQQRTTTFLLLTKALQLRLEKAIPDKADDEDTKRFVKKLEKYRDTTLEILFNANVDTLLEILSDWAKTRSTNRKIL